MKTMTITALSVCAGLALAASANAQALYSLNYNSMPVWYVADSGTFSMVGSSNTDGIVSRDVSPIGTALFATGLSTFSLDMSISGYVPGVTATGTGSFTATDTNGSKIVGDLGGQWIFDAVFGAQYYGQLSNVKFQLAGAATDYIGTDGQFTTNGIPLSGLFGQLQVQFLTEGSDVDINDVFGSDFRGPVGQFQGQIIPAPSAAAMLGLGGATIARRRRR